MFSNLANQCCCFYVVAFITTAIEAARNTVNGKEQELDSSIQFAMEHTTAQGRYKPPPRPARLHKLPGRGGQTGGGQVGDRSIREAYRPKLVLVRASLGGRIKASLWNLLNKYQRQRGLGIQIVLLLSCLVALSCQSIRR